VRGVRVELRSRTAGGAGDGQARRRKKRFDAPRMLTGVVARGVLAVLPFVPIRVKDIVVEHQVTLCLWSLSWVAVGGLWDGHAMAYAHRK